MLWLLSDFLIFSIIIFATIYVAYLLVISIRNYVTSFVRIQPFCLWKYSMFIVVSNCQILLTGKHVWCMNHQHNKIMVHVWNHICPWMNIEWLYISILWLPFLSLCCWKRYIIMAAIFDLCHCSFDFSLQHSLTLSKHILPYIKK